MFSGSLKQNKFREQAKLSVRIKAADCLPRQFVKSKMKRLSPREYRDIKERMGDKKFHAMKFYLKHQPHPNGIHKDRELASLEKSLSEIKISNVKDARAKVNALFNHAQRIDEKRKDYFKDRRWKRAQGEPESRTPIHRVHVTSNLNSYISCLNNRMRLTAQRITQPITNFITSSDVTELRSTIPISEHYIEIFPEQFKAIKIHFMRMREARMVDIYRCYRIENITINVIYVKLFDMYVLMDIPSASETEFYEKLVSSVSFYISKTQFFTFCKQLLEDYHKIQIAQTAEETALAQQPNSTFFDRIKKFLNCPYCHSETNKCKICLRGDFISPHIQSLIEDIAIAVIQICYNRNILTFVAELIRIYKALTGLPLINGDLIRGIADMFKDVIRITKDFSEDLAAMFENISSLEDLKEVFRCLLPKSDKNNIQAQAEPDYDPNVIPEMRAANDNDEDFTKFEIPTGYSLSSWMETDLVKLITNWWSYILYMCISKQDCGKIPFMSDLLRATLDDGKKNSKDLLRFTIRTLEFAFTKGKQYMEFGFQATFYHSQANYLEIQRKFDAAKADFIKSRNPELYNLPIHEFIQRLGDLKDKLKEMCRVCKLALRREVQKMYLEVVMMWNEMLCGKEVMKDRKAPYAVLVYGNTSVGKNFFINIVNKALCDNDNKTWDSQYIYTLNDDKRADGFKSHHHTALFDDVANRHPNVCPNGDPSINNIIGWVNNCPKITEQAQVEDKGKIPVWIDYLLMTANSPLKNTQHYLSYPSAVMRRVNLYIHIDVKEDFKENDMIKPSKIPEGFIDVWDIKVQKFFVNSKVNKDGKLKQVAEFSNIYDFLIFMAEDHDVHKASQTKRMDTMKKMKNMDLSLSTLKAKRKPSSDQTIHRIEPEAMQEFIDNQGIIVSQAQGALEYGFNLHYNMLLCCFLPLFFIYNMFKNWSHKNNWKKIFTLAFLSCARRYNRRCLVQMQNKRSTKKNEIDKLDYEIDSLNTKCSMMDTIYTIGSSNNVAKTAFEMAFQSHFEGQDAIDSFISKFKTTMLIAFGAYIGYKVVTATKKAITKDRRRDLLDLERNVIYNTKRVLDDKLEEKRIVDLAQGSILAKESSKFWVDTSNVLRDIDVGASSMYYKNNIQAFMQRVAANTVFIQCKNTNGKYNNIRALCLGGFLYVANRHTVRQYDVTDIYVVHDKVGVASANVRLKYDFSEAIDYPEQDLIFFYIDVIKPKKNLYNLLYRGDLQDTCFEGCYLKRNIDGLIEQQVVHEIKPSQQHVQFADGSRQMVQSFNGLVSDPTILGDCGSVMIVFSHYGPMIVGLHITGDREMVAATRINTSIVDSKQLNLGPDLAPIKMKYSDVCKTLVPERAISHPGFLPSSAMCARYGSFANTYTKAKTSVTRTLMAPEFEKLGFQQLKTAPPMNNWRNYRNNLVEMTNKTVRTDVRIVKICKEKLLSHVTSFFNKEDWADICVITNEANVNGWPGVDYIDSINRSTSMGFPWNKPKKNYLSNISTEVHPDGVQFDDEIMQQFTAIDYMARAGIVPQSVYSTSQKDEPITFEKASNYGTRLFFGAPAPTVLLIRKYFLSIIRIITKHRHDIGVMVGIITQSREWTAIYNSFPWKDRMLAGDFSKFDKKQDIHILRAAFDMFIDIAKMSNNYDEPDIRAMETIKEDSCFAMINFDGDLMHFLGILASGIPVTVNINSFAVILLYMYIYYTRKGDVDKFFEYVRLLSYGDDSIASVSPECTWLNHNIMAEECEQIGMKYTMAEKDAQLVPFINIDQCTFLKRSFVLNNELKAVMAPLDPANMINALMVWVASKNIEPYEQANFCMQSSIREWFFHGRDEFERWKRIYYDIYTNVYHRQIYFPDYQDVLDSFESHTVDATECYLAQGDVEYELNFGDCVMKSKPKFVPFKLRQTPVHRVNRLRRLLRLAFGCTALYDDLIRKILCYLYGQCRVCHECAYKSKLCFSHWYYFSACLGFQARQRPLRPCQACGNFYCDFIEVLSNWYSGICGHCLCVYICDACSNNSLCSSHLRIIKDSMFSLDSETLRLIIAYQRYGLHDPSPELFLRYKNWKTMSNESLVSWV